MLKRAYNAGVTNIKFQCRNNLYVYDFERMVQINAETRTAHAIRVPEDWKPPSRPWVSADSVWAPARWMKAMFDADPEGATYVPALDTKVSFFEATPSDGKKHIRWSVDEKQVQQLFGPKAGHTEVVSTGIEETDGPKESQPSLSRSESFRALQQRSLSRATVILKRLTHVAVDKLGRMRVPPSRVVCQLRQVTAQWQVGVYGSSFVPCRVCQLTRESEVGHLQLD